VRHRDQVVTNEQCDVNLFEDILFSEQLRPFTVGVSQLHRERISAVILLIRHKIHYVSQQLGHLPAIHSTTVSTSHTDT